MEVKSTWKSCKVKATFQMPLNKERMNGPSKSSKHIESHIVIYSLRVHPKLRSH